MLDNHRSDKLVAMGDSLIAQGSTMFTEIKDLTHFTKTYFKALHHMYRSYGYVPIEYCKFLVLMIE